MREFDPSTSSGKKWLETMANQQVKTGTKCHHISNNAPQEHLRSRSCETP